MLPLMIKTVYCGIRECLRGLVVIMVYFNYDCFKYVSGVKSSRGSRPPPTQLPKVYSNTNLLLGLLAVVLLFYCPGIITNKLEFILRITKVAKMLRNNNKTFIN